MKFNEQLKINKTPENEDLSSKEKASDHLKNIEEVFKLNPELANAVYEALGFKNEQSLEVKNKKIYEPRQGFYYRGIGEDGLKDAIESGFFRSPTMRDTYKGIYKTSEIYWADANNFEVAKRTSIRTNGSIREGESVIVEYPSVSEIFPKEVLIKDRSADNRTILDNYASQTNLPLGNARILIGDRKTGIYNYIDFNQITPQQEQQAKEIYSQYLDTIFPDSKVKDIVYHASSNKIERFRENMFGVYFSYSPIKGVYGDINNTVLLNITNPLIKPKPEDSVEIKEVYNKDYRAYNNPTSFTSDGLSIYKYDASIESSTVTKEGVQIKVRTPEQIHILGSEQDLIKFKEFVSTKKENEMQNIDDISFEEVSPDTSDSIEIKVYKDDSEEIVLKKLKEKLIQENWWLQDEFKNEGIPKEQFIINGNNNEYSIYNFNDNLSIEQQNSLIKGISFLENSMEISSLKGITILIRKTERINSNSKQPFYGNNYEDSKVINIYPRALKNEGYREIPEISGLEATVVHEFSHPIYSKMEQKLRQEWSNFGWETATEEEQKNENIWAIKPKESNKCVTKYAQFAPDEDFCESIVGLYAQSSKLDSKKKTFLENNIFNKIENIPLVKITKKEKVELPKLPENIKFHKKEVSKISIVKK